MLNLENLIFVSNNIDVVENENKYKYIGYYF